MSISSYFDYPSQPDDDSENQLIFLVDWNDEDWDRLLAHMEIQRFRTGDLVIRVTDQDRALYIVAEGRLEVVTSKGRSIAVIEAGSVVGEQVFLDGQFRSANVKALTNGDLLRLSLNAFELFATKEPDLARRFLFDLGRILSLRLRDTTALALKTRW